MRVLFTACPQGGNSTEVNWGQLYMSFSRPKLGISLLKYCALKVCISTSLEGTIFSFQTCDTELNELFVDHNKHLKVYVSHFFKLCITY